jgi:hypothetical protein
MQKLGNFCEILFRESFRFCESFREYFHFRESFRENFRFPCKIDSEMKKKCPYKIKLKIL